MRKKSGNGILRFLMWIFGISLFMEVGLPLVVGVGAAAVSLLPLGVMGFIVYKFVQKLKNAAEEKEEEPTIVTVRRNQSAGTSTLNKKQVIIDVDSREAGSVSRGSSAEYGKVRPAGEASRLTEEQAKKLYLASQHVREARLNSSRLKDSDVKISADAAIASAEKIITTLRTQPEEIRRSHQFLNYYLPTLSLILKKYKVLEDSGVKSEETRVKVLGYLLDIYRALDKQYETLFEDELLDLDVEMEAMQMAFKRDGLITDSEIQKEAASVMMSDGTVVPEEAVEKPLTIEL